MAGMNLKESKKGIWGNLEERNEKGSGVIIL